MYVWSERTENSDKGNKNIIPSNYYLYDFHEVKLHVEKPCTVLVNSEIVHVNKNLNVYININDKGLQNNKLDNYTYVTSEGNGSTHLNSRLGQLIIVEKEVDYYWTGLFQ
ncbi:hypothetical protein [Psychrobacillus sp. BM2]|uniref:hypothetical protein n=1 Tax=Psychrobacillus sp. BM2 TaxID=3400421 RepID=UPI003B0227B8